MYFYFILKVFRGGRGQLFHLSGELFSMFFLFFFKASLFHVDLEMTSRGDECPGVCLSTAWLIYGILQSPPLHVTTLLLGVVGEGLFWKYSGKVVLSSVFVGVSLRKDRLPMRPFHEDHSASYLSFLLYPPKSNFRHLCFNFDIFLKKRFCFSLLVFKG